MIFNIVRNSHNHWNTISHSIYYSESKFKITVKLSQYDIIMSLGDVLIFYEGKSNDYSLIVSKNKY